MSILDVPDPDGFLYIVADSHLDEKNAPAEEFVEMLVQLENPHTIVFLGDLFKIWLAPPKFWSDLHRQVLLSFQSLKDKGSNVVFIAGNREMLLPRKFTDNWKKKLPFTHLIHNDWFLNWGNQHFGFIHGDTINYHDRQYLRWKSVSHSLAVETIFQLMPGPVARWVAERIEAMLVETNKEYKVHFPEKEIQEFAESVLPGVDNYFVGHFHVDREIKVDGCSSVLRVVPDWLSQRKLIRVSAEGTKEVLHFQNGLFENAH